MLLDVSCVVLIIHIVCSAHTLCHRYIPICTYIYIYDKVKRYFMKLKWINSHMAFRLWILTRYYICYKTLMAEVTFYILPTTRKMQYFRNCLTHEWWSRTTLSRWPIPIHIFVYVINILHDFFKCLNFLKAKWLCVSLTKMVQT